MTLTKDMGIMEVVSNYPETVEVFINAGMGCPRLCCCSF